LGAPAERINDDRLNRALDRLLPHKQALETHLKERLGALFDLDYELLLYDVTSTYFEGQAEGNGLARRGYRRDHRGDCKQVCIGLVVTRDGVPLGYEVFAGNRTDVTTVEEIVTTMERRYGQARRVWVMDRGMASAENIAWLRGGQRLYVIGASKSELKKFAGELADRRNWRQVRDGVEAKVCAGPDGSETFLLVRSAERQQKEQAMHARFCERIETALASLQRRIERAQKPIDRGAAERQIGRLLGRNSRAAARLMRSVSSTTQSCRLAYDSNGRGAPNGTTGRVTAKAATCWRQSARLELRGAVADLYPAFRSGSGLSHP
jgi:transposase